MRRSKLIRLNRPFGVVFMGSRVTEINQHAVAHIFGDKTIEPGDDLRHGAVIGSDELTQIFPIKTRRQRGRAHKIAEHHRNLAPLGLAAQATMHYPRASGRCLTGTERNNGTQEPQPGPKWQAKLAQVFIGEITKHITVDRIVMKRLRILLQADGAQPIVDVQIQSPGLGSAAGFEKGFMRRAGRDSKGFAKPA